MPCIDFVPWAGLGVDIWVEDVSGESLKIRERPQVKIGHIAVGISEQVGFVVFLRFHYKSSCAIFITLL